MKKRNEVTSPRIAKIAGRVLQVLKDVRLPAKKALICYSEKGMTYVMDIGELKALCASALTQAEGKK